MALKVAAKGISLIRGLILEMLHVFCSMSQLIVVTGTKKTLFENLSFPSSLVIQTTFESIKRAFSFQHSG